MMRSHLAQTWREQLEQHEPELAAKVVTLDGQPLLSSIPPLQIAWERSPSMDDVTAKGEPESWYDDPTSNEDDEHDDASDGDASGTSSISAQVGRIFHPSLASKRRACFGLAWSMIACVALLSIGLPVVDAAPLIPRDTQSSPFLLSFLFLLGICMMMMSGRGGDSQQDDEDEDLNCCFPSCKKQEDLAFCDICKQWFCASHIAQHGCISKPAVAAATASSSSSSSPTVAAMPAPSTASSSSSSSAPTPSPGSSPPLKPAAAPSPAAANALSYATAASSSVSAPISASKLTSAGLASVQARIRGYFRQITIGCGKSDCKNKEFCVTAGARPSVNAAQRACELAKEGKPMCAVVVEVHPKAYDDTTPGDVKQLISLASKKINDIGTKCIGVMQVNVDDQVPFYIVSTSAYGVGVTGKITWYNNTNLQSLRDFIANDPALNKKVIVAPLEMQRTIYDKNIQKTSFHELRKDRATELAKFIQEWIQRFASRLSQFRDEFSKGTWTDNDKLSAINKYLDSSVFKEKIRHPFDREQMLTFFFQMTSSKHLGFAISVLGRMLHSMHSDDMRQLKPYELRAGIKFMNELAARTHKNYTADEMIEAFRRAAADQKWVRGESISDGPFISLCKNYKIEPSFGNVLFFYFKPDIPDPTTTELGDFVSQCAEDNAAVELFKHLPGRLPKHPKQVIVQWYSVGVSDYDYAIYHKELCPVCNLRFVERLTFLLARLAERHAPPDPNLWEKGAVNVIANSVNPER